MKISILFFLSIFFVLSYNTMANAENTVVQCGIPSESHVETDPGFQYCNIFDRQFTYRKNRIALMDQLKIRQTQFIEPALSARNQYKKDLDALHDSIN
ncbi:MAG: hypothetical protein KAJ86_01070 [Alphaproteobacteria bacterium]|nr:hypothetical protein [Alphaproteobacteria bacterium]